MHLVWVRRLVKRDTKRDTTTESTNGSVFFYCKSIGNVEKDEYLIKSGGLKALFQKIELKILYMLNFLFRAMIKK